MDNLITLRFFRIETENVHTPSFLDALNSIFDEELPQREVDINPGVNNPTIVRLEQFEQGRHGIYSGEFVRKQVNNIPPEATAEGLVPIELADGSGLGYSSVFVYHEPTGIVLLQSHPLAVTASRLRLYLAFMQNGAAQYSVYPAVKSTAWERFNDGPIRKFTLKIASPTLANDLDGAAGTVQEGLSGIGEALDGPYIKIEVSMGTKAGELNRRGVLHTLRSFLSSNEEGDADIRQLQASVRPEGEELDLIDFLDEHLLNRTTLGLADRDIERNFQIRLVHAKTVMNLQLPYLIERYGPQN